MKKIALFVAAFCFTIGMAFAQEPKKPNTTNTNAAVAAPAQHHSCSHSCGTCPHHAAAQQQAQPKCETNQSQCQQQPKAQQAQPKVANQPAAKPAKANAASAKPKAAQNAAPTK